MGKDFRDRQEFIDAQSSEKITLVQVEATKRLIDWTHLGSTDWMRVVPYYVVALKIDDTEIPFVYDPKTGELTIDSPSDPGLFDAVVTYRFFFSDAPVTASHDMTDAGTHVHYEGRISKAPGYNHKIGYEQKLTSIIGTGIVSLENNDGGLDEVFDTVFFENQKVFVYSWNRDINFSEAQIIYRGRVTNKKYTSTNVEFRVKDTLFDLNQTISLDAYTDSDNVNDSVKGRYKRRIYGRVDGLKLQSVDQIGEGYTITGTVSADTTAKTLTGSGTAFLSDVSPEDKITVGTQEFTIESVESNTSLTLDNEPRFAFTDQELILSPDIPTNVKNREYFVAGHACARLTKQVVNVIQLNRVELTDTVGLSSGDFIEFIDTGERVEIKNTAPGNIIVLVQNIITEPGVGTDVTRQPIQRVYIEENLVPEEKYAISTVSGETKITFTSDVEFSVARLTSLAFDATFTNGSRTITYAGDKDIRDIISPRDFIRPNNIAYTNFYEVLDVQESEITIRVPFIDPTITDAVDGVLPDYLADNTIVSSDILGKTVDGLPDGDWLQTGSDVVLDIINELGIAEIDTQSFVDADNDNKALISMALPLSPTGSLPTAKSIVDIINKSVVGSLTLNRDLELKYNIFLPVIDPNIETIRDEDVINWSITTTNNDQIRNMIVRYRHKDVDRFTQESGTSAVDYESLFVKRYIGTNATAELDIYIYDQNRAQTRAHREVYYRSLGRADLKITTDLRLERFEIGDQIEVDFDRLYKRFGDLQTRKKICVVVGKKVTGQRIELELTDLGNIFNRSSIITPNDAADYNVADTDEKLRYGYITDNRGITDDNEDTANLHLIS